MVHKHSPAARERRRERARHLGYLQPSKPSVTHMEVDRDLAPAVKGMAASLRLHRDHDRLTQSTHHSGHLASLAAFRSGDISKEELASASAAHRRAGRLKHRISANQTEPRHQWADLTDDPADGAAPSAAVDVAAPVEPVPLSPPPARGVSIGTQTGSFSFEAYSVAPAPAPLAGPEPWCSLPDVQPLLPVSCHDYWNELFGVQNSTIALLTGRLDECMPSQKRMRALERQVHDLSRNLDTLRTSMSSSIDEKLSARLAEFPSALKSDVEVMISKVTDNFASSVSTLKQELNDHNDKLILGVLEKMKEYVDTRVSGPLPAGTAVANFSSGKSPTAHDSGDSTNVNAEAGGSGSPPAAKGTRGPSAGDTVRLSGVSNPTFRGRIARVLSSADADARLAVRLLPNGPDLRVPQAKVQSPATCRMCGDRIFSVSCQYCLTPADFEPPHDADLPMAASALPVAFDSQPESCASGVRARSPSGRVTISDQIKPEDPGVPPSVAVLERLPGV